MQLKTSLEFTWTINIKVNIFGAILLAAQLKFLSIRVHMDKLF